MTVLYPIPTWMKFLKALLIRYILIDLGERKNSWHSWICPRLCKGPLITAKLSFLVEFYWHPKHQTKLESDTCNSWQKGNFAVTLTEKVSPHHRIDMIVWTFPKMLASSAIWSRWWWLPFGIQLHLWLNKAVAKLQTNIFQSLSKRISKCRTKF